MGETFFRDIDSVSFDDTIIQEGGLACLEKLPTLEEIRFYKTSVPDTELARLVSLKRLKALSITYSRTEGNCLKYVGRMNQLVTLELEGFDDNDVKHLSTLVCLERLELDGVTITNIGLEHLTELTHLTYLGISASTRVTDEGVKRLRKALPNCHIYH